MQWKRATKLVQGKIFQKNDEISFCY